MQAIEKYVQTNDKDEEQEVKSGKRQFGQFKGKVQIGDDFDDALPDNFWTGEVL